jgi:hypothetical protein
VDNSDYQELLETFRGLRVLVNSISYGFLKREGHEKGVVKSCGDDYGWKEVSIGKDFQHDAYEI